MTEDTRQNPGIVVSQGTQSATRQQITPCLWFDTQAAEAARFYTAIFPNSSIGQISHYGESTTEDSGRPPGSVMTVTFTIAGQEFLGLNGGPAYQLSPAISFMVNCDTQEEIDYYWDRLLEGGEPMQCGWLADKFGVSWQIVPTELFAMMKDPDPARVDRMMARLLQMVKLDVAELQKAFNA